MPILVIVFFFWIMMGSCKSFWTATTTSPLQLRVQQRHGHVLNSAIINTTYPIDYSSLSKEEIKDQGQHALGVDNPVQSVNFHLTRKCNYACKFCFHTQKTTGALTLEEAVRGMQLLREAGTEKINFAGGEPFLRPQLLGQLCQQAHELGMAVSIISNGSLITKEWMKQYGYYVDVLGVSVDSFCPITNALIGRGEAHAERNHHLERVFAVREWCREQEIVFKVNTVVCRYNWEEDMVQPMRQLNPKRWKVFQVLILEGENAGKPGDLRNAVDLVISDQEYQSFVGRHAPYFEPGVLVPESNDVMQNSYIMLDEEMRFLDCSTGGKVPSRESILTVGVEGALRQTGFDYAMFQKRGGKYEWTRER